MERHRECSRGLGFPRAACAWLSAVFLLTTGVLRGATVNVYLMAGQSNMQGLGDISQLSAAEKTAPHNTRFWNGASFEAFRPGVTKTSGNTPLSSNTQFGPELAFAAAMAAPEKTNVIIKYYRGGTALDAGWSDQAYVGGTGANRYNFHAGTGPTDANRGLAYIAMMAAFKAGIQNLVDAGDTPVIGGMLWMQGEQDTKHLTSAENYTANLQHFVTRVMQDLNVSTLPFIYGQAAPSGAFVGETPVAAYVYRNELRAAQAAAEALIPESLMVSTNGYEVLADHAHYSTASQLRLGEAFARGVQSVTAVPEPAVSGVGLLAALGGLALRRRLKSRRV